MGASCTKGSKTTDPDRTPYGKPKSKSSSKKDESSPNQEVVPEVDRPMSGSRRKKSDKAAEKSEKKGGQLVNDESKSRLTVDSSISQPTTGSNLPLPLQSSSGSNIVNEANEITPNPTADSKRTSEKRESAVESKNIDNTSKSEKPHEKISARIETSPDQPIIASKEAKYRNVESASPHHEFFSEVDGSNKSFEQGTRASDVHVKMTDVLKTESPKAATGGVDKIAGNPNLGLGSTVMTTKSSQLDSDHSKAKFTSSHYPEAKIESERISRDGEQLPEQKISSSGTKNFPKSYNGMNYNDELKSPYDKHKMPVDMKVETNMAIFDALKGMKTPIKQLNEAAESYKEDTPKARITSAETKESDNHASAISTSSASKPISVAANLTPVTLISNLSTTSTAKSPALSSVSAPVSETTPLPATRLSTTSPTSPIRLSTTTDVIPSSVNQASIGVTYKDESHMSEPKSPSKSSKLPTSSFLADSRAAVTASTSPTSPSSSDPFSTPQTSPSARVSGVSAAPFSAVPLSSEPPVSPLRIQPPSAIARPVSTASADGSTVQVASDQKKISVPISPVLSVPTTSTIPEPKQRGSSSSSPIAVSLPVVSSSNSVSSATTAASPLIAASSPPATATKEVNGGAELSEAQPEPKPRLSKLPTSRLPSSSLSPTSPNSSTTSPALTSPPVSSPRNPISPLQSRQAAVAEDDEPISSDDQHHALASLLVDLSSKSETNIDSNQLVSDARSKLLKVIERWLAGNDMNWEIPTRALAIHGNPGVGKTCFLSEICKKLSNNIAGSHFFRHNAARPQHNLAVSMLLSLAHKLCEIFPSYVAAIPRPKHLERIINREDIAEVFDVLITKPLTSSNIRPESDKHMLIVLDAVDECNLSDRDQLLRLINDFDQKSPEWLYIIVTLTDDTQLVGILNRIHVIEVKGSTDEMTIVLKRYFKEPMTPFIDRISLDGAQAQLQQRSDGNFLCAYFHKKHLESLPAGTKIALRDLVLFPSGLNDVYKTSFQRLFDYLTKKVSNKEATSLYSSIVGLLTIAQEPIDKQAIKELCGTLDVNEALSQLNGLITTNEGGLVSFYHKNTSDWIQLLEPQNPLAVNIGEVRLKMADMVMGWLDEVLGEPPKTPTEKNLQIYALKHALTHLTDIPKQQDNITRLLCSLNYVQEKLMIPMMSVRILLIDYKHKHHQQNGSSSKVVTLEAYMKKFPDLAAQIENGSKFLLARGNLLEIHPEFTLIVAANFPTNPRIQQNARVDLSEQPWLENLTAVADTPFAVKKFEGSIMDVDTTSDNKIIVIVMVDSVSNVYLHVINAVTGVQMFEPIDVTGISNRIGVYSRVMADNTNVFVGSISTYVNIKTGKAVPSGLDMKSVPIKEQFSIECCDLTASTIAFGVTTLPFGGRSLHMIVFDLKSKKFAKNLEVLKFKFGGSAQFGVKACALSADSSLLCACTKQTNKNELKVIMWSTSSWNVVQTVDVENDMLNKCAFVGNNQVVIGGSIQAAADGKLLQSKTYLWSIQGDTSCVDLLNKAERSSISCVKGSHLTTAQWFKVPGQVIVNLWKKTAVNQPPDGQFICYGLDEASDLIAFEKTIVFVQNRSIRFYKLFDLGNVLNPTTENTFPSSDAQVLSVSFFPRSDEPIVTYRTINSATTDVISSCKVSLNVDGTLSIASMMFTNEKVTDSESNRNFLKNCFTGPGSCRELCRTSADGVQAILSNGNEVLVVEVATGVKKSLPAPIGLPSVGERHRIKVAISPKDSLVGVIYGEEPARVVLYDIKAKPGTEPAKLQVEGNFAVVDDFCFMPSNGYVVTYCETPDQSLSIFNHRSSALIHRDVNVDVAYIAISPTSDRLAVSRRFNNNGTLTLRSSDNTLSTTLKMASEGMWLPDASKSDVEFSSDGTTIMGVCVGGCVGRIWNAGNGEVLIDLNMGGFTGSYLEIVGMPTNTHALLYDATSLYVCDIGSASIISVLPLEEKLARKWDGGGLRVSPRGNVAVGATREGSLRIFLTHNVAAAKRKTTLQILKSK